MKKITVCMSRLREEHRAKITSEAEAAGYSVAFFDQASQAGASAAESEIILADGDALLAKAEQLKWFCASFAGVDHLLRSPYLKDEVLLSNSYTEIVRGHRWDRNLPVRSIRGSRVLIIGTGDIGHETALRLRAFGPACIEGINRSGKGNDDAFDSIQSVENLEAALPEAEIVILCIPGTKETRHLLNAERLAMLPAHAMIINVGRGQAIDQKALVGMLTEHRLGGAALDVFEQEPVPPEDPVWTCPGLLVTPHCSGNTSLGYTVNRIVDLFCEDFRRYVQGLPLLRTVNRTLGY